MKRIRLIKMLFFLLLVFTVHLSWSQGAAERKPLYLDLNKATNLSTVKISDDVLSLQYHDAYGRRSEFPVNIYNWKREQVASVVLTKSAGLNHYAIRLQDLPVTWKKDETYSCEATDEVGKKYSFSFRLVAPPKKEIVASIFVNPRHLKCNDPEGNLVEFYGEVTGGKAPYTVNWYILDQHRSDLLYQPKEESISRPGNTAVVQVDKSPDYYVIFAVRDACGNEQHQVVNLVCEKGKKKINTLFFESIQEFQNKNFGKGN
jgi:hypothetical protein